MSIRSGRKSTKGSAAVILNKRIQDSLRHFVVISNFLPPHTPTYVLVHSEVFDNNVLITHLCQIEISYHNLSQFDWTSLNIDKIQRQAILTKSTSGSNSRILERKSTTCQTRVMLFGCMNEQRNSEFHCLTCV